MANALTQDRSLLCRCVLIVEDDAAIRESLALALEVEGYSCAQARNGQEALELLGALPKPCLILLDLMMPVMNGWEFLKRVGEDVVLAQIPIAVLSAYTERVGALPVGAVLKKPIDLNLLLQVVHAYCRPAH